MHTVTCLSVSFQDAGRELYTIEVFLIIAVELPNSSGHILVFESVDLHVAVSSERF